ncbi:hypothetical protein [Rubrimonas cliftonensis]|uniref:Uncharacterized protein n=1 Tax=Rubrimonas cliftonensis TaxID=89524 RepID=A0A1H3VGD1_9RHOB|nr:hypothetical protein [Rubrimonas cliftonensis]SDZ73274.1 hypothetical protein SAMN05444370_10132 [Rubrimonas cliftonensis]
MAGRGDGQGDGRGGEDERRTRLAAALRDNLRRRKQAKRAAPLDEAQPQDGREAAAEPPESGRRDD